MRLRVLLLASVLVACSDDEPAPETQSTQPEIKEGPAPERGKDAPQAGAAPQCASGADIELEDNGTPASATLVTGLKFCGVLADGADVDHFTFTTPPGTKLGVFQAVVTEPVDIAITVNGKTYAPGDPALATSGTFVVRVAAKGAKAAAYQARLQYDAL